MQMQASCPCNCEPTVTIDWQVLPQWSYLCMACDKNSSHTRSVIMNLLSMLASVA